ncbi:FAD-dependent oxidoreductase [Sphaerisporangium aureirubrum]|uniref:FAD-dependent oxidoreductase n=1 Tax=Sphaerisporangium aureirubrum TaxID=1544736 RepID=A0ABW1NU74_9ACTN
MATSDTPHILIIGGGLGGLCLAQGLAATGLSAAVYERDAGPAVRGQGYRITLKQDGVRALRACLPEHLAELCAATAIRSATTMTFLDERLVPKFAKPIPDQADSDAGFGVNRLTLREILLTGLPGNVHFGKQFQRYETRDGRVVAHFADGTSATGDLLVGADGTGSAVRRQLLPDAGLDDLGCFIYGRTPIGPDTMSWLPEVLTDSFNRVTDAAGTAVSVATCRAREPYDAAVARLAPGARLTPVPDYLAWTISGQGAGVWTLGGAREPRAAGPEELHRLAATLVRDWDPRVGRVIAEAHVPDTFLVTLASARPVELWDASGVTLLGDAVHTMSPGRGEGANTALRDAALLRDALASGRPLAEAVPAYEHEMLRYGFAAVTASRTSPFMPRPATPAPPAGPRQGPPRPAPHPRAMPPSGTPKPGSPSVSPLPGSPARYPKPGPPPGPRPGPPPV